jgi:tRNA (guanine37-N1)-methyltransferase
MKVSPIYKALIDIKKGLDGETLVLLTSAKGIEFNEKKALSYSKFDNIIIICGHYEGVDERVSEHLIDEEISIGKYVLSNGEIPTMVITDSIVRLLPGVLGNNESLETESHNVDGLLEYPQYTKPEVFELNDGTKLYVPKVLLSGDHTKINEWKEKNMKRI